MLRKSIIEILKGERPLKDVIHYLVGNYRYKLYYSKYQFLLKKHIREQITERISVMNRECYYQGSCIMCGCETTALQMCNKSCEGNCYPPMMSRCKWNKIKKERSKKI